MPGSSWLLLLLLLLSAAAAKQTTVQQQQEDLSGGLLQESKVEGHLRPAAAAESQQVSLVADQDLDTAATGYGGDQHHKAGYHEAAGYKGNKGHKAQKGYKKNQYGDHAKAQYMGYHDTQGKKYKGHDDKEKYYGDSHKGKKGKKGHHYGSKGHHNKGHKDKGFKNVYHKEEYHHNKKFYDDHDSKKYHNSYDDFDSYFKAHKGNDHKSGHYKRNSNSNKETESSDTESKLDSQPNHSSLEDTRSPGEPGNPESKPTPEELPNRVVNEKTGRALNTDKRKREDRDVRSKKTGTEPPLQDSMKKKKSKRRLGRDQVRKRVEDHLEQSDKEADRIKSSKIESKGTQNNDTHQKKKQTNSQKKKIATRTRNKREKPGNKNISKDKNLKHSDNEEDEKAKKTDSQENKSATKTGNWKERPGDKNNKDLNISKDKDLRHSDNRRDERVKKTDPQSKKSNDKIRTHKKSDNQNDEHQKISKIKSRKGRNNQKKGNVQKRDFKISKLTKRKNIQQIPRNSKTFRVKKHVKQMNKPDSSGSVKRSRLVRSEEQSQRYSFKRSKTRQLQNNPTLAIIRMDRRICRLKCRICLAYAEQKLLQYHEYNQSKLRKRQNKGRGTTKANKIETLDDKVRVTGPQANHERLQESPPHKAARAGKVRESKESKGSKESKRRTGKQVGVTKVQLKEETKIPESQKRNEQKLKRNPRQNPQELTKNTGGKQKKSEPKISQKETEKIGTTVKKEKLHRKSPKSLSKIDSDKIRNVNKSPTRSTQHKKQTERENQSPKLTKPQDVKKPTKQEGRSKIVSPAGRDKGRQKDKNAFRNDSSRQKETEGDKDNKPNFTTRREKDSFTKKKRETESTSKPKGNPKYIKNRSKSTGRQLTRGAVEEPGLREAGKTRPTGPRGSVGSTASEKDKARVTNTEGKRDTSRKTMYKHPSNLPRQGAQQKSEKPSGVTQRRKRKESEHSRPESRRWPEGQRSAAKAIQKHRLHDGSSETRTKAGRDGLQHQHKLHNESPRLEKNTKLSETFVEDTGVKEDTDLKDTGVKEDAGVKGDTVIEKVIEEKESI